MIQVRTEFNLNTYDATRGRKIRKSSDAIQLHLGRYLFASPEAHLTGLGGFLKSLQQAGRRAQLHSHCSAAMISPGSIPFPKTLANRHEIFQVLSLVTERAAQLDLLCCIGYRLDAARDHVGSLNLNSFQ